MQNTHIFTNLATQDGIITVSSHVLAVHTSDLTNSKRMKTLTSRVTVNNQLFDQLKFRFSCNYASDIKLVLTQRAVKWHFSKTHVTFCNDVTSADVSLVNTDMKFDIICSNIFQDEFLCVWGGGRAFCQ